MTATGKVPASFTRMDESSKDEWMIIAQETMSNQPRVAETVLSMMQQLEEITDGFAVNQLVHCLQTAGRAEAAGADEEVIVASLLHDIGKVVSVPNHPKIAAEILRPYVREEVVSMIAAHQDFQGRHYYEHLGMDPNARDQYVGQEWFSLAEKFADEWDQTSFDPDGPTPDLSHFEPMVRRVFAQAHRL
jgi:predicted HD phosphohydrolase